jgi:hypothetical protein
MVVSTYGEYSPQGRYLFGVLTPLAIALAAGWYWLGRGWRMLRPLGPLAVAGIAALGAISLLCYVVPRDFSSPRERLIVEIDRPFGPQARDSQIEVLGWSMAQGAITWRPFSPDVVNQYRRPSSGVVIYLDGPPGVGVYQGPANYGFRRRDVSEFYGSNRRLDPIGYRYVFPAGAITPGEHRLYACALAPTVTAPTCTVRLLDVT